MSKIPKMRPCSVVLDPGEVSRYFEVNKNRETTTESPNPPKKPRTKASTKELKVYPVKKKLSCRACTMTYQSYETLYNHYGKSHKIVVKCEKCCLFNINIYNFYTHLLNQHKSKSPHYTIDKLITKSLSQNPIEITVPAIHYECLFCSIKLDSVYLLTLHVENFHCYCKICFTSYENIQQFNEHKEQHDMNNIITQQCQICKKDDFQSFFLLLEHFRIKHVLEDIASEDYVSQYPPVYGNSSNCSYCSMTFVKTDDKINNHLLEHEINDCVSCKIKFITNEDASSDFLTSYCLKCRIQMRKSYFEKLNCNICNKQFLNNISFHKHELTHHDIVTAPLQMSDLPLNSILPCLFCDLLFKSDDINDHIIKSHTMSCTYCSIDFKSSRQLRYHQFLHHAETYECTICSKSFENCKKYFFHHKLFHDSRIAVCKTLLRIEMSKVDPDNEIVSQLGSCFCVYCDKFVEGNITDHLEFTHLVIKCACCEKFARLDPVNQYSICTVCKLNNARRKEQQAVSNFEFVDVMIPNLEIKKELEDEFLNENMTFVNDDICQSIKIEPEFENDDILMITNENSNVPLSDISLDNSFTTKQQTSTINSTQLTDTTNDDSSSTENSVDMSHMFSVFIPDAQPSKSSQTPLQVQNLKQNIILEILHCSNSPPQLSWKVTFNDPTAKNDECVISYLCKLCKSSHVFESLRALNSHIKASHFKQLSNQMTPKYYGDPEKKMYVDQHFVVGSHKNPAGPRCYVNILQSLKPNKNRALLKFPKNYEYNIKQLPCLLCSKLFNDFNTHSSHVIDEHIYCKVCEKSFASNAQLQEHINDHQNGTIIVYKCKYCLYMKVCASTMKEHLVHNYGKTYLKDNTLTFTALSMQRGGLECAYCILNFSNEGILVDHMKEIHQVNVTFDNKVYYLFK